MRTFQPSVLIESSDEVPIAMVEVKGRRGMSRDAAVEIRSSMLERGLPAHIPYFLLLSPDVGFLWKDDPSLNAETPPDYEFPMNNVIVRYSKGEPEKWLYRSALEYLVLRWLTNLSLKPQEMAMVEEPEKTLVHTGFTDAIYDAMVLMGDTI
jgi:hypothetical protein